MHENMEEPVAF